MIRQNSPVARGDILHASLDADDCYRSKILSDRVVLDVLDTHPEDGFVSSDGHYQVNDVFDPASQRAEAESEPLNRRRSSTKCRLTGHIAKPCILDGADGRFDVL